MKTSTRRFLILLVGVTLAIAMVSWIWQRHSQAATHPDAKCVTNKQQVCIPCHYTDGVHDFLVYARAPIMLSRGQVEVKAGNDFEAPIVPAQALAGALNLYPQAKLFRVSWQFSVHDDGTSTVLYNRGAGTIRYFCSHIWEVDRVIRHSQSRCLVSGVTDAMLHQLATSNKGETLASGPLGPLDPVTAGFTLYLTRYGAHLVSPARGLRP